MKIQLISIILISFCQHTFGQEKSDIISFSQSELIELNVFKSIFQSGIIYFPESQKREPCFRDYRKNSLELNLENPKTGETVPLNDGESKTYSLTINTKEIFLNRESQKLTISGTVSGGWYGAGSDVDIYIGQKVDTTSLHVLSPDLHYTIIYEGKN